jgi:hypothetical protein
MPLNDFIDNDNHNLDDSMFSIRCVQEFKEKIFEYDQKTPPHPPPPFVKVVFKIFGDLNLYFQFEFEFRNTVL